MLRVKLLSAAIFAATFSLFAATGSAQTQPSTRARFDVTNYRIEVQLHPEEHTLRAGADIISTRLIQTAPLFLSLTVP